jgi:hypothetical protein
MRGIVFVSPFTKTVKNGGIPDYTVSFALAADPLSLPGTYLVVADGTPLLSFEVLPGSHCVQIQTNRYGRWKIYPGLQPWTAKQMLSGVKGTGQYQLSDDPVHNTALCLFEDFDVTDFNGLVPKIEIIAAGGTRPARCPCADMDWMGHDMTAEHHPDCPTRRERSMVTKEDYRQFIDGKGFVPKIELISGELPPCPKATVWDAPCRNRFLEGDPLEFPGSSPHRFPE